MNRFKMVYWLSALVLVLAACGGASESDTPAGGAGDPETTVGGADADTTQTSGPTGDSGDGGDLPAGTVTVNGVVHEVSGLESSFRGTTGDFKFCTYRDGGEDGQVTIEVDISEDETLSISFGRADGLGPSGRYPTGMDTTEDVDAALEDGRARGTATFDDGLVVEFDVMCES